LTDAIGSDFIGIPEAIVDLGISFTHVESAAVDLKGRFQPGLITRVTIPPNTSPLLPNDNVNLIVRLGEVGSSWLEKDVYAIQELQGFNGDVSFTLPLQGAIPSTGPIPVLLPSGELAPDYRFLLDGRFGISAGSMHWLASIYQELEPPRFELTEFVLRIEGAAVPEPAGGAGALTSLVGLILGRRRRSNQK
jgi:hypothetical protein